jgi:hypothetical protein
MPFHSRDEDANTVDDMTWRATSGRLYFVGEVSGVGGGRSAVLKEHVVHGVAAQLEIESKV